MKLWRSKADKEQEVQQDALDIERRKLRQFQAETSSILDEAINELMATKAVLSASEVVEERPELHIPLADFVVALDKVANVLSIVDVDDVQAGLPLDLKVERIRGLVKGGAVSSQDVTALGLDDSTILYFGGDGLFIGAVWHGEVGGNEKEMTKGSWESARDFFGGAFPEEWSETDTLTLYNSIRASFGKEIMEIEGLAPEMRARVESAPVDRKVMFREIDILMKELKAQGFSTTRLHEIRTMPTKEAKRALDKFRSDLKFVRLLEARFYKLDAVDFPEENKEIFRKLRTISHLTEAALELEALEGKVAEWEAQQMAQGITADGFDVSVEQQPGFEDIMDGIKNMELSGFDTRFIYRQLYTGDLDSARQALMYCLGNIERLRKTEDRLLNLWAEGYEDRFMSIQNKLTNPAMAATVEKEFNALEATIKADSERERIFTLLRGKLDSWTEDGFNVEELRNVLTKDPDTIIETFKRFSNKISFLVKLEDDLNALEQQAGDTDMFMEELANIRRMLMDPTRTTEIMDELRTMRFLISRRGDEEALREVFKTKVARWWEKGYDVTALQAHMDQPVEVLEDLVGDFETFVGMLEDIEKELEHIYLEGFEQEEKDLRSLLKDIKNVSIAKDELKELKAKVTERIKEEDMARASGELEAGPPVKSPSLLATIILRIGHRLPVALWGKEPGELAEELLGSEYGKTRDGELIVKVGRKWYYGDPRKEDQFLTTYTVEKKR